jgi:hypothetical protein
MVRLTEPGRKRMMGVDNAATSSARGAGREHNRGMQGPHPLPQVEACLTRAKAAPSIADAN